MLTRATWQQDMEFKVDFPLGESLTLTSIPKDQRPGPGPSPVEVIQAAVAGCTGMDVVMILRKMRKTVESFSIEIDPLYVDVAIRRWQNHTGQEAIRESDGAMFSSIEDDHAE